MKNLRNFNSTLKIEEIMINPPEETVTNDRDKFLGGSDIAKITSKRSLYNIFKEKQKNRSFSNEYTELGHEMEDNTKEFIRKHLKENIISACYVDNDKSVRANVDGLMFDDKGLEVIEMKNNTIETSFKNIEHYIKQVHFYMYMLNTDRTRLFETERKKDSDGNYVKNIDLDMIECNVIPRNDKIIDQEIEYINDFKYLLTHPHITYNEFIGIKQEDIESFKQMFNSFLPTYTKYKQLKYEKESINKRLKELVSETGEYENGSVKISERKGKTKLNNLKIYKDYKQDYINYITLEHTPDYRYSKEIKVNYVKVKYDNFDNVNDLLSRLGYVDKELKDIKKSVEETESVLKDILFEKFPNGVDLGEDISFIVNKIKVPLSFDKFLDYVESKHDVVINRDKYMEDSGISKVYKITPKVEIIENRLIDSEIEIG